MNTADFRRPPCQCLDCQQAGVNDLEQIRDPRSGSWLHGRDLKRWYLAEREFWQKFKHLVEKR
jgi:hypothetical protein